MATVPLATCAPMLGNHPKTLHYWLNEANLPLAPHPTDARSKGLAEEPLLEVARRHSRPLPALASAPVLDGLSAPDSPEEQAKPLPAKEAEPNHPAASIAAPCPPEADLIQRVSCLETKIVTLQEQLAQLALALRERARASCRAAHRRPGSPPAAAGGKTTAFTARTRGRARVCLCGASGASASAGRTTCALPHASSDRRRRARNLGDYQPAGRRVAPGAGFGAVV
jgi:hypothetical protein